MKQVFKPWGTSMSSRACKWGVSKAWDTSYFAIYSAATGASFSLHWATMQFP